MEKGPTEFVALKDRFSVMNNTGYEMECAGKVLAMPFLRHHYFSGGKPAFLTALYSVESVILNLAAHLHADFAL